MYIEWLNIAKGVVELLRDVYAYHVYVDPYELNLTTIILVILLIKDKYYALD